jgi:heavy metal translocating P-type ATPase
MLAVTTDSGSHRMCCDFCELPLTHEVDVRAAGPHYCCYGCQFAASLAGASGDEAQTRWTMTRLGLSVFFSMNVMVCTLLLWSEQSGAGELSAAWYDLFRSASLLFSLPVVLLLGPPLATEAWRDLTAGRASMNVLLVVGVLASLGYSAWSVLVGGHVYCEVACAILLGVTLGKWFEANGKLQTTAALRALARFLPETVRLVRDDQEAIVPAAELQAGESFRVLPGERLVADGRVERGQALVDEQAVTGESLPVLKLPGATVFSGTQVIDAPLVIAATAPAGEGTMARLIAAVKQGAEAKTHYERLAERISRWFLPLVLTISLSTLLIHWQRGEVERGLLAAVAVLVIACPCSLGLATPMALWAAISRAAEEGILIRSGDALTQFATVRTMVFDKTGTLTTGQPRLAEVHLAQEVDRATVARVLAILIVDSLHPLAATLRDWARDQHPPATLHQLKHLPLKQLRQVPGQGISALDPLGRTMVYLGNRRWLEAEGQDCGEFPADHDSTETILAWGGRAQGQFRFAEELRPGLTEVLQSLRQRGLQLLMLTGDRGPRAEQLAATLGLNYRAELLPTEKLAALQQLSVAERPVAMVGDGINDAPALAAADVGISLASGVDIARDTAAICLLRNHLNSLPFLHRLAIRTRRALHWNLTWAFAYNVIGLALAAAGWIHPAIAAIAMGISGLFVVLNSLSLARFERVAEALPDQAAHSRPALLEGAP